MISEIQKSEEHITQVVVHADFLLVNYFYLQEVQSNISEPISHNLVYQLFSMFTGRDKSTNNNIKDGFKLFWKTMPAKFKLKDCKGQEFQTVIASIATNYESFIRNQVLMNYERRKMK